MFCYLDEIAYLYFRNNVSPALIRVTQLSKLGGQREERALRFSGTKEWWIIEYVVSMGENEMEMFHLEKTGKGGELK